MLFNIADPIIFSKLHQELLKQLFQQHFGNIFAIFLHNLTGCESDYTVLQ